MNNENRFAPPTAVVADVLGSYRDVAVVFYEVRRLDYFLFILVHQLRMPALQILFIGVSIIFAVSYPEFDAFMAILMGIAVYIAQWTIQILFLLVIVGSKNKRLYTRHEVQPLEDSLGVLTTYARQYYYWQGLEKIVCTPWFVAVYVTRHTAHIIPNRAFQSKELRNDFIKLVRTMRNT